MTVEINGYECEINDSKLEANKEPQNVNHPKHYAGGCSMECIDVMRLVFGDDFVNAFCVCNAFKYMWRYKNKNGFEDLMKADWYLSDADKETYKYDEMRKLLDEMMGREMETVKACSKWEN